MVVACVGFAWEPFSEVLEMLLESNFFHEKRIAVIQTGVMHIIGDVQLD